MCNTRQPLLDFKTTLSYPLSHSLSGVFLLHVDSVYGDLPLSFFFFSCLVGVVNALYKGKGHFLMGQT